MNKLFTLIRNKKPAQPDNDFSAFFLHAKAHEKKQLMVKVIREANKEQKAIVDLYNRNAVIR